MWGDVKMGQGALYGLFGSRSTFGRKHSIWNRAYKGHGNKRQQRSFLLYFRDFFIFEHEVLTECAKTTLQTFCIIFESPFGIIIPKIQNLCFVSQTNHLRFSPNYMHLF